MRRLPLLALLLLTASTLSAQTFYVSTTGNDANAGTSLGAAWRTIQHSMNAATAGSTVNIVAGTYHERLTMGVSGTSGNVITFQPNNFSVPTGGCGGYTGVTCGGDSVILDYSTFGTITDGVPLIDINGKSFVTIQGLTLQNFTSQETSFVVNYAIRTHGSASNVTLQYLKLLTFTELGANGSAFQHGVWCDSPATMTFQNSEMGAIHNHDAAVLWNCSGVVIANNYLHDIDQIGIDAWNNSTNYTVSHNKLDHVSIQPNGTPYYGNPSVGLYNDGGNNGVWDGNWCNFCGVGIEDLAEPGNSFAHDIKVRNNIVENSNQSGLVIGTWYSSQGAASVSNINIWNNTFYNNSPNVTIPSIGVQPFTAASVTWENNIFFGTSNYSNAGGWATGTTGYNLYAGGGGTGPGSNNVTSDPLFTNAAGGVFTLSVGSPAINAGDPASSTAIVGTTDFAGSTRILGGRIDIGALEQSSGAFFAQVAAGTGDGSSCANARASSTHVAGDDAPGNTLHLCGLITGAQGGVAFASKASGTSGNPITLKFEPGAVLSSPAWGGSGAGAITIAHNFWTVDGGTNGKIQNTLDGNAGNANCLGGTCTVQQAITYAVFSTGTNATVENLTATHMCMHTFGVNDGGFYRGNCVGISLRGDNSLATQNTIDNASVGVECANVNNCEVSFNTMTAISRFITSPVSANTIFTGHNIHNNDVADPWVWDEPDDFYHHNCWHAFTVAGFPGAGISGQFYYNYAHGIWGKDTTSHVTGCVFINDAGVENHMAPIYIVRNVMAFDPSSPTSFPNNGYINYAYCTITTGCTPAQTSLAANNTCVGNGGGPGCFDINDKSTTAQAFNNLAATTHGGASILGTTGTCPPTCYPSANIDNNFYPGVPTINGFTVGAGNVNSWTAWSSSPYFFDVHCNPTSTPPGSGANCNPTLASANIGSNFRLGTGSTAISAAKNLTSLCGTIPALCVGAPSTFGRGGANDGVALPAIGNWDAGAYPAVTSNAPSAPTGLTASVAGSTVSFNWTASGGTPVPTAYTLYRGTVHNGPYTAVKSGITALSTTDAPANGTYFYVVTAFVGAVVSTISGNGTTATVTCMSNCSFPSGTVVTLAGDSAAAFNGTFTSTGQPTSASFTFASSSSAVGSGGGAWQASGESAKSNEVQAIVPSAITFSFAPTSLTFASTTVGASSGTQTITVTNTSSAGSTVTFSSITFAGTNPGDFSRTTSCTSLTTPGQQCTVVVTFTPTATGARSASLTFVDNATGSPQTIPVSGTGVAQTPGVSLSPTSLNFQSQTLSTTSVAQSIILTNTGSGTLTITSVVASGDFAVTTVPATNCGTTLASLATCSLNVTFTPTATGGRTGAVTVTDNAVGSPHVATLSGTGITTKCSLTNLVTLSGNTIVCGP